MGISAACFGAVKFAAKPGSCTAKEDELHKFQGMKRPAGRLVATAAEVSSRRHVLVQGHEEDLRASGGLIWLDRTLLLHLVLWSCTGCLQARFGRNAGAERQQAPALLQCLSHLSASIHQMPGKDDSFPGSRAYSSFRFLNRGQFGRWDSDNQTSRSSLTGSLAPLKPWCLSHSTMRQT